MREITTSEEDLAIAAAVVALGQSLNLKVVAEGVETLQQADCLRALGCHEIQGYLLSRPQPADKLVEWLQDYRTTRKFLTSRHGRVAETGPMTLFELADADDFV